jgi:hypothetical protein
MTERNGAIGLRHLGARATILETGDGDSLENINTTILNDGCLCYVTEIAGYYMFDRNSVADAVGDVVIAPSAGPGRWLFLFSGSDAAYWAQVTLILTPGSVTIGTQSQWENQPAPGGSAYSLASAGPGFFTLTAASGLLTYNGPDGKAFEITVNASVANEDAAATISVEAVPSLGTLVGTTTDDFTASRASTPATQDFEVALSSTVILLLNDGDIIRAIFRNLTTTDDISVERLTITVTAVV